jgi:hypothetical protein
MKALYAYTVIKVFLSSILAIRRRDSLRVVFLIDLMYMRYVDGMTL